jgi:acyl carrier protein
MSHDEQLRRCFRAALELPADAAVDDYEYAKIPVWDSVAHMRLIARIEQDFDIMFSTDQILEMNSFSKALELVTLLCTSASD